MVPETGLSVVYVENMIQMRSWSARLESHLLITMIEYYQRYRSSREWPRAIKVVAHEVSHFIASITVVVDSRQDRLIWWSWLGCWWP